MNREDTYRSDIASVVDLAMQIDRDRKRSEQTLRRRDREIGRELDSLKQSPRRQILAWLSRISERNGPLLGARLARALRVGSVLLVLAGLILGWITAAAVYYYDGSRPVNVIHVLAVFVGAQLVLIALLLLTLIPRSYLYWLPGARSVLEILDLLSPGRLQRLVSRYLPQEFRQRAEALIGTSRAHGALFGGLERWLVTSSSQLFAVAFNGGALIGCLYLILFSDLAFSWSTTLQVTEADIHSLTHALSAPWRSLVRDATPSLEMIRASRYYRLEDIPAFPGGGATVDPAILGGWWPFLFMCMLFYGLIPRFALWAFSDWRLRRSIHHTLLHLPGVPDLLDRMNRELVETRGRGSESVEETVRTEVKPSETGPVPGASCVIINWGDIPISEDRLSQSVRETWGSSSRGVLSAGGAHSLGQDAETIDRAVDLGREGGAIVFVKSWEPPLEDLHDFLTALRAGLPDAVLIVVSPLGMKHGSDPSPPSPSQLNIWRTNLQLLGDPWLSVQPLRMEES
jgi:hypothetical protein